MVMKPGRGNPDDHIDDVVGGGVPAKMQGKQD